MPCLDIRSGMNSSRSLDVAAIDQRDPGALDPAALAPDKFRHKHASRRDHVGNASSARSASASPGRPEKHGVEMNKVEAASGLCQCPAHGRRPIQATQNAARKVTDLHAFELYRNPERHVTVARPVYTRCEDMDIMSQRRQLA